MNGRAWKGTGEGNQRKTIKWGVKIQCIKTSITHKWVYKHTRVRRMVLAAIPYGDAMFGHG